MKRKDEPGHNPESLWQMVILFSLANEDQTRGEGGSDINYNLNMVLKIASLISHPWREFLPSSFTVVYRIQPNISSNTGVNAQPA